MPWLVRLFPITGYGALPCVWAKPLLFWMLALDTSTLFRMFPRADSFPTDYPPGMGHAFASSGPTDATNGLGSLGMSLNNDHCSVMPPYACESDQTAAAREIYSIWRRTHQAGKPASLI